MKDFARGSIPKHLISFSLPIVLGDFLFALYYVIDAIWVGRLIGYKALASISTCMPILFFLASALIGLRVATNILVAQSYGAKDFTLLSKVLSNSLMGALILCLAISIISISFTFQILTLLNTPADIFFGAQVYFIIIMVGLVFRFFFNWLSGVLKGLGDSKTPLVLLILSLALNIIFTPLFILGTGPLPALGIAGAALATVVSTIIVVVAGMVLVQRRNHIFDVRTWDYTFNSLILKKFITLGLPISGKMLVKSFSWIILMSLVNTFGPSVTAAYGIGIRIDMFAFLPALSMGVATSSMVAQNIGAKKYERIGPILISAVFLSLCFSLIFFLLVNISPQHLASIFTKSQRVHLYATAYWRIVSISYLLFSLIFTLEGVIRGCGDTGFVLLFSLISVLCIRIPLAYILCRYTQLAETGIWTAILISAFVAALLNYIYYASGRWRRRPAIM